MSELTQWLKKSGSWSKAAHLMLVSTWNRDISLSLSLSIYSSNFMQKVVSKIILVTESNQYYAQVWHQDQMLKNQSCDYLVGVRGLWVLFCLLFILSNFYPSDMQNETCGTCVAVANLRWNISKNRVENWSNPPCWSYDYQKRMVVDFLAEYIGPPNYIVLSVKCGVVNIIWRCSPISFKCVSLLCLFFDPHLIIHQTIVCGPIVGISNSSFITDY
jgi:hypothetical protein